MPSTKEKNSIQRARVSDLPGVGGEPPGEPPTPPPRILDSVPDDIRRQLPDDVVDELLAGARTEKEIVRPTACLAVDQAAGGTRARGRADRPRRVEAHQEPPGGTGNTRNGSTPKTLPGRARAGWHPHRTGSGGKLEPHAARRRRHTDQSDLTDSGSSFLWVEGMNVPFANACIVPRTLPDPQSGSQLGGAGVGWACAGVAVDVGGWVVVGVAGFGGGGAGGFVEVLVAVGVVAAVPVGEDAGGGESGEIVRADAAALVPGVVVGGDTGGDGVGVGALVFVDAREGVVLDAEVGVGDGVAGVGAQQRGASQRSCCGS